MNMHIFKQTKKYTHKFQSPKKARYQRDVGCALYSKFNISFFMGPLLSIRKITVLVNITVQLFFNAQNVICWGICIYLFKPLR